MSGVPVFAFDFDGVLVDSAAAYVQAVNRAGGELGASRRLSVAELAAMEDYRHGCSAERIGLPASALSAYSEALRRHFHVAQARARLHPGMAPVLAEAAAHGGVVVVSANAREVIEPALRRFGAGAPPIYAGRGRAGKAEVLAALAQRARVLMVGDTLSDCRAAAEAGVGCVAVAWGWQGAGVLRRAGVPVVSSARALRAQMAHWRRSAR